jgi:allantoinase
MAVDLIIRGGNVVRADGAHVNDIAIDAGKIVEVSPDISLQAKETIDASGMFVFPGVIDSHVHFNEPGRTEWEGISTGSSALAAGGGTCFFDMPLNSSPPVLDGESFDRKLECAKAKSLTDFGLWGGLTPSNLDKLEELADRGVVGFKAFMSNSGIDDFEHVDDVTLWRGMKKAAELGLPVAVHAENDAITAALSHESIAAGRTSAGAYIASRPVVAECEAIARAIALAQDTKCRLHIVHVSSFEGVMAVRRANNSRISCETCPHYLALTSEDVERIGAAAKCAPPIRASMHQFMLQGLLRDGGIDFVASDHSPSPASMKTDPNFFKIWGGIAGVQSTLPLLLTLKHALTPERIADVIAGNVAATYRIPQKEMLGIGLDADMVLVDPGQAVELKPEHLLQRHKISPYLGMKIHGMIQRTILRGRTIFLDGRIVGEPSGAFVRPVRG